MSNLIYHELYKHKYTIGDLEPIRLLSVKNISDSDVRKIVNCYNSAGFVLFELLNDKCSHENLKIISQRLKLGGPFVPNIYSKQANIYNASGFNIIKSTGGEHRAFQTSNEQKLHSDGTVEEIGKIKTSILLCVKPSDVGGETIIFNSVGAFYYLLEKNKKIAYSLFDENALRRVAVNGENEEYVGPVFSINDGNLNSRFSLDNTCDWAYGFEKVEFLKEAYNLLNDFVNPGSSFYISVRLKENQGIIMANNKISHGRKAYKDTILNKREMIRGLFEKSL